VRGRKRGSAIAVAGEGVAARGAPAAMTVLAAGGHRVQTVARGMTAAETAGGEFLWEQLADLAGAAGAADAGDVHDAEIEVEIGDVFIYRAGSSRVILVLVCVRVRVGLLWAMGSARDVCRVCRVNRQDRAQVGQLDS